MFLPLKDDNPVRTKPLITQGIIALNLLVFFYQLTLNGQPEALFIYRFGLVPQWLGSTAGLDLPPDWLPRWTTLVSYMFLHGGIMHLGSNLLFLWIFGKNIEDVLGKVHFVLFYLAGGLAAAGAQYVMEPGSRVPMIGASRGHSGGFGGLPGPLSPG